MGVMATKKSAYVRGVVQNEMVVVFGDRHAIKTLLTMYVRGKRACSNFHFWVDVRILIYFLLEKLNIYFTTGGLSAIF